MPGSANAPDDRCPVIVGVGQVVRRPGEGDASPVELALAALRLAGEDSGSGERLLRGAQSIRHVATAGWPYRDEAALIARALGAEPRERVRTTVFGGDGPARLVGDAARAIAAGELDIALVSGAESVASTMAMQRSGARPPWPVQDDDEAPTRTIGIDRIPSSEQELAVGLVTPIYDYALIECAIRRRLGSDPETHGRSIARLWAGLSRIAQGNPYAWLPKARSEDELLNPTPSNRPISSPYTKLLTANLQVDQASALIICSAGAARAAGVALERWVFIEASSHTHDEWFLSERSDMSRSPAIAAIGAAALGHAGLQIDDVSRIDLYSCFPSAVQIAAHELGLPIDDPGRPLSLTGGLTFAGGPGNNYPGHAIATLVQRLREDGEGHGISTAVGWYLTKHAIGIYGAAPPRRPFREIDAADLIARPPARSVSVDYRGPVTIEAYTVPYARDGAPEAAIVSALTADGMRVLLRSEQPELIAELLEGDAIGRAAIVEAPTHVELSG